MPNFKLGDHYKTVIKDSTNKVLDNYVKGFVNNFPLTHGEVQSCIMSAELLTQFEALSSCGVKTISRSSSITCTLDREMTAGLKRSCVLLLQTTNDGGGFFTVGNSSPYLRHADVNEVLKEGHVIELDLRTLPADRVQAVVDWCHMLIRATRLRGMVQATIAQALRYTGTTAHLLANWPELATFTKEDGTLRKRLAAPPQKMDKYLVPESYLPPKKQRDAANVVLAMGAMAIEASKNTDEAEVRGSIHIWEDFPTDPTF